MTTRRSIGMLLTAFAALAIVSSACREVDSPPFNENGTAPDVADAIVAIDTLVQLQVMTGWEAVAYAGQGEPRFAEWQDALLDAAVNDLGLNRIRLELKSGSENRTDFHLRRIRGESANPRCERYFTVNDNNDPSVMNLSGFHFSELDSAVVNVVVPMRQRLQARGEKLFLNLNYVAFLRQCEQQIDYVHGNPAEYAELILAAFLHFKSRYGFVPDAVEIILEPDNVSEWSPALVGQSIVRTAALLSSHGFRPEFVAPSTTSMANAVSWTREMLLVPGVAPLLSEISYHRYAGVSESNLAALSELGKSHNKRTAMLEHIGSDVDDLYDDITAGGASAWQQFTIGAGVGDGGGQYYQIINGQPVIASRTRYLRQYFHYVRFGARRVAAVSSKGGLRVVAFQNQGAGLAVVIHTKTSGTIEVRGLSPGRYGASITTEAATGAELGDRVAGSAGSIVVTSTGEGVLTVYRK